MSMVNQENVLSDCSYTIQLLFMNASSSIYVIREHDAYGEFPNIYVKVYFNDTDRIPKFIILSDSGTGLDTEHHQNIATFLARVLNAGHAAPYILLTTHCHYDHIGGIRHLLDANGKITVFASSYDKDFLTPWRSLQKHSLCPYLGLKAPEYDAHWIEDGQRITYSDPAISHQRIQTSITVIQTPGHTPDSISWYDHDSYTLCVSDMFYEKESDETRSGSGGSWGREPPQPVVFVSSSNIVQWNASMHRLLDLVRYENRKLGSEAHCASPPHIQDGLGDHVVFEDTPICEEGWSLIRTIPSRRRVALCASHVTISTDAEFSLLEMLAFMLRVQLDQVPKIKACDVEGNNDVWLWDDALGTLSGLEKRELSACPYSIKAPWSIIHETTQRPHPICTDLGVPETETLSRSNQKRINERLWSPSILSLPKS